ncbi:MAG: hypothetical protein Q7K43_05135, partial [Candidatus Woesearchaeota archaeon]|nr:hypothetical protein [Candidatus Woesearchaeota archaeon]
MATLLLLSACVLPPQGIDASSKNTTLSANKVVTVSPQNQTTVKANQTSAKSVETKSLDKPRSTETKSPEGKLPTKFVKEGELVSFPNLKAKDPEGDSILYIFSAPLNDKGQWQTKAGDAGTYKLRITASDGKNTVQQEVILIVEERNGAPVLELSDITITEGELARLSPKISDPDGDAITLRYSGWMNTETRQTTFADAGVYDVTVVATDGKSEAKKTIRVTVKNMNRAPKLDALNEVIKVKEGDKVSVVPTAKDPDGDKISFAYSAPLDTKGQWQTKKGDAGSYRVNVTASDGTLNDAQRFFINVETLNNKPTLTVEQDKITVNEGERVSLKYVAKDADND